jgi:chitodextrinase
MKPSQALRRIALILGFAVIPGAALPAHVLAYSYCSAPAGVHGSAASPTDVHLTWQASGGCSSPSYQIFRDGGSYASAGSELGWDDIKVAPGSTHAYRVRACTRRCGALSGSVTVTTPAPTPPADTTPPTVPTGVQAHPGNAQVSLSWTASGDPDGPVAGYYIFRGGARVATTAGTSYTDSGLSNGTTYSYTVAAYDSSGNTSAQSSNASATPQAPSSSPPACWSSLTPSAGLPFCLQGQAAASPMNQPLPVDPTVDPNSAAIVANLNSGQHNADYSEFGTTVNDTTAANTTVTLHCTQPWGTCSLEGKVVAVNTSWRPSWGSDGAMVIVDRSARKVYDLWQVATTSSGTIAISNGTVSASWGGVTSLDGNGQNVGATGSNLSHLFGMVRMFEMANAPSSPSTAIGHALAFSSSFTCPSYRYPALKDDGHYSGACIPEGARVFLDSTANCSTVSPVGAEAVCYALQKYGAYSDDTGGSPMAFVMEGDGVNDVPSAYANAGVGWDYYNMSSIPWSHLHVAADCQCTAT